MKKENRLLTFALFLIIIFTSISYPMKAEAAGETVKIKSATDVNKHLSSDKYMLGLLGVNGVSGGVVYSGNGNAEVMSEWHVGEAYTDAHNENPYHEGESNLYTLTYNTKYAYNRVNKVGRETSQYPAGYNSDGTFKNVVYPDTAHILGKKFVLDDSLLTKGYHWYNEELPVGTQIPIRYWVAGGVSGTIHQEDYDVVVKNYGTTEGKLLGDGRWAMYHGIEFHAGDYYDNVKSIYNGLYPESSCGMRGALTVQKWNYTYWWAFCDICGEPVNAVYSYGWKQTDGPDGTDHYRSLFHWYAPKDAVQNLPVLEVGAEVALTCPYCGGMENTWYIQHKCKTLSPNMYFLKYDKNADDAQGFMSTSSWLTNFEDKYNGVEVPVSGARYVSQNKYFREGYSFKGWSLTPDGPVDLTINNRTKLTKFQQDPATGEYYDDNHVTTLYAVWGPEENTLSVDTYTKNTVPNVHSDSALPVWNTSYTGNGVAAYGKEETGTVANAVASWTTQYNGATQTKIVNLNSSSVHYPSGSWVIFSPTDKAGTQTGTFTSAEEDFAADLKVSGEKRYKVGKVYISEYTTGGALHGEVSGTVNADGVLTKIDYTYGQGDGGYEDVVYVLFEQEGVVLPNIEAPAGKTFVGWYTADDAYAGAPGDYYASPKSGDTTLYPKFNEFKVEVVDIYYKNAPTSADEFSNRQVLDSGLGYRGDIAESANIPGSALSIRYATGAVNFRMSQFSAPGTTTIYKAYWAETKSDVEDDSDSSARHQFDSNGTDAMDVPESVDKSFAYDSEKTDSSNYSVYTYTVPSTGTYDVTIAGAGGTNYVESGTTVYKGGAGDVITQRYFLNKGDVLRYVIGKVGGGSVGKNGEVENGLDGGDRSYVQIKPAGKTTWTTLLVAGGGGSASASSNGGNGGETVVSHLLTSGYKGEDGDAGGGAGSSENHGGKAGVDGSLNSGGYYKAYINAVGGSTNILSGDFVTFSADSDGTNSQGSVVKNADGSVTVTNENQNTRFVTSDIAGLIPGKTYTVSAYYKKLGGEEVSASSSFAVIFNYKDGTSKYTESATGSIDKGNEWEQRYYTFTVPSEKEIEFVKICIKTCPKATKKTNKYQLKNHM